MKPIKNNFKWPKFLRVNFSIKNNKCNKFLPKPWKEGEIVKVLPFSEQVERKVCLNKFVCVLRKDDKGKFTILWTWDWNIFDLLTK